MHFARSMFLATLLPLFAGCQLTSLFDSPDTAPAVLSGQTRMQGTLSASGGQLLFHPCDSQRSFVIDDGGKTGILQEAATLSSQPGSLFADLRGRFDGNTIADKPGQLNLQTLYRIERVEGECKDPNFPLLGFYASGDQPAWNLKVNGQGLVIERPGEEPIALPYLEEQLPGGRVNLSSDANNRHIDVWMAPQRCVTGSRVSFLSAEVRIDDQTYKGCAYLGGARSE